MSSVVRLSDGGACFFYTHLRRTAGHIRVRSRFSTTTAENEMSKETGTLWTNKEVTLYGDEDGSVNHLDFEGAKVWSRGSVSSHTKCFFVPVSLIGPHGKPRKRYLLAAVMENGKGKRFVRSVKELNPHTGELVEYGEGITQYFCARASVALGIRKDKEGHVAYDLIDEGERERVVSIAIGRSGSVTVVFCRVGTHWGNTAELVESIVGSRPIWKYDEMAHKGRHFHLLRLGGKNGLPYFKAMFVETVGTGENEAVVDVGPLSFDSVGEFESVETTRRYMEEAARELGIRTNDDPTILPRGFVQPVDTAVQKRAREIAELAQTIDGVTLH
jgi:hypothetical protein